MTGHLHEKCRGVYYPKSGNQIRRFPVPDEFVDWDKKWAAYRPVEYTAPSIKAGPSFADPPDGSEDYEKLVFNQLNNGVDRRSHMGEYELEPDTGRPINPLGRTGVRGRGILGKWGPNHAADPIVTRWKKGDESEEPATHPGTKLPILQVVLITRGDCGELAIPGGMVDAGERVSQTLVREFCEEALNEQSGVDGEMAEAVGKIFAKENEKEVYKGYVDDPRNTDNAWMETVAVNFHDQHGITYGLKLCAGSDASGVRWVDADASLKLYASHFKFIAKVCHMRGAHFYENQ